MCMILPRSSTIWRSGTILTPSIIARPRSPSAGTRPSRAALKQAVQPPQPRKALVLEVVLVRPMRSKASRSSAPPELRRPVELEIRKGSRELREVGLGRCAGQRRPGVVARLRSRERPPRRSRPVGSPGGSGALSPTLNASLWMAAFGASSTARKARDTSWTWTTGRQGLPSLNTVTLPLVTAEPMKSLKTVSKRIRGDRP